MECKVYSQNINDLNKNLIKDGCFILTFGGNFNYFFTLNSGLWQFELWGAASGYSYLDYKGKKQSPERGLGSYVSGLLLLKEKKLFYGYVGGRGGDNTPLAGTAGFNGGVVGAPDPNDDCESGGSGGATDIRLIEDDLYSRIIVAGGGGSPGCSSMSGKGGSGGTFQGIAGLYSNDKKNKGGKGADFNKSIFGEGTIGQEGNCGAGSGGGGYFGGYGGHVLNKLTAGTGAGGGGGGSSYISGIKGCKTLYENDQLIEGNHYSGFYFTKTQMISGDSEMPLEINKNYNLDCHISSGCIKITNIYNSSSIFKTFICKDLKKRYFIVFILILIYK